VLRLSKLTTSILEQCSEERTCEELAQLIDLPLRRVQTLCEQLRWKGLLEAGPTPPPVAWPGVSLIVPSHNRAQQLERCLRSLLGLDYPAQCLELIVVDDASTDETATMLERLTREAASLGIMMQVIHHTPRQGVAQSRNSGAEAAHHDLLAYTDSDCVTSPGWLAELVPAFQDAHIGAVSGMIRAYERQSLLGRYEDVRSSLFMGTRPQQVRLEGPLTYVPTANLLVRRALWQRLGGFAPLTFGEDVDFCRRLLATGSQLIYLPQGVIYHDYRTTLHAFLGIRMSYASSEAALLQHHPTERRVLLLPLEQAMFAGLVIGGVWGMFQRGLPKFTSWRSGQPQGWTLAVALLTLLGTYTRWRKVRQYKVAINPLVVLRATLRAHLAYTYHLCRHLTRYYTLPLLAIGLFLPPILLLVLILYGIVIAVDYVRLRPCMSIVEYALCALLDDCAYEVGVVLGCIKHRTWKPLLPVISLKGDRKDHPYRTTDRPVKP